MKIRVSAPSNIALIKYMGKDADNRALNDSLSYTLEHLRSHVEVEELTGVTEDRWELMLGFEPMMLSEQGRQKFLNFWQKLKDRFEISGNFTIRSANDFPSDCGLASSASSFAALTMAAHELAVKQNSIASQPAEELAWLSRTGSGSSCRSFFGPWAVWEKEGVSRVEELPTLEHAVVVVETGVKSVSSSEAHRRVQTSQNWPGRAERARVRLEELLKVLRKREWRSAHDIVWAEFWDMHALFETSSPSFGYFKPGTVSVLERFRSIWEESGDGPLVTMDAGANVHILLRPEQKVQAEMWLEGLQTIRSWKA